MQDEWNDFLHTVISGIYHLYPKFANAQPQSGCLYDDDGCHLGWKACTVCYPFEHDSDLEDNDEHDGGTN